jgi:hypothetical protein
LIRLDPETLFIGSIFISVIEKQSGKLIRQPVYFPQREKSTYSSARSPLRGTMPARLRMTSSPGCLTFKEIIPEIGMLTFLSKLSKPDPDLC